MQIVVGQSALVGDFAGYAQQFGALEVSWEPGSVPKTSKLERWRAAAPEGFVWSVVFPSDVSALHERMPNAEDLASTLTVASCLSAQWLVLRTAAAARPDSRVKQRIRAFRDLLGEHGYRLAWEPAGLWEARAAGQFAAELGLTLALDLSRDEAPQSELIYTRLRTRGRPLGENQLLRLLERVIGAQSSVVIVDGRGADQVQRWLKDELQLADDSAAASA